MCKLVLKDTLVSVCFNLYQPPLKQTCQFPLYFGAEFGAVDATEGSQKLIWSCERSTDAVLTL